MNIILAVVAIVIILKLLKVSAKIIKTTVLLGIAVCILKYIGIL